jgi:type II secretory pathway component PulM
MSFGATALRATVILAVACATLAVSIVWLVLTDPVTVVTAVNRGDLTSLFDLLTRVATQAFHAVAKYL